LGFCRRRRCQADDPSRNSLFAQGTTDGVRGDIVQQIITIVRRSQTSHLASRIPWTMTYPADSPIFMVLGTYYDADHAAKSLSDCGVRNWGTRRDGTEIDLLLAGDYWPRGMLSVFCPQPSN
jgi:hypothetical protein